MPIHVFDAAGTCRATGLVYFRTLHVSAETLKKAWDKIAYARPEQVCACDRFTHIDSVPNGCDLPGTNYTVLTL